MYVNIPISRTSMDFFSGMYSSGIAFPPSIAETVTMLGMVHTWNPCIQFSRGRRQFCIQTFWLRHSSSTINQWGLILNGTTSFSTSSSGEVPIPVQLSIGNQDGEVLREPD